MASLFTLPKQVVLDTNGQPVPGALVYFYAAGTLSDQSPYTDIGLTTPHDQPVTADAYGVLDAIYLDPEAASDYRVQVKTAAGVLLYDQDDVSKGEVSASAAAAAAAAAQSDATDALADAATAQTTANAALPKAGGTMTGTITSRAIYVQSGYNLEIGHASDTSVTRLAAGQLGVEGKAILQHAGAYTGGKITVSASAASGGNNGDIWLQI